MARAAAFGRQENVVPMTARAVCLVVFSIGLALSLPRRWGRRKSHRTARSTR